MSGWDATRYQDQHSFVWRFGANLVESLNPQPGERILDLGCGTGQLTAEIARSGATVTGLDSSLEMLVQARKNYPDMKFVQGDAASFCFPEPFDAVFSNAVLHWVRDGVEVRNASLFDRPTPLEGEDGMANGCACSPALICASSRRIAPTKLYAN